MAQKFLTNVELEAGLVDGSNSAGTSGYLLSSTGTATSWVDPAAVSVGESEQVHIACKNTSGVAISKGDPVYITGTVGTSFRIQIAAADASNSAKMPAVGLAETDLGINAEGFVIVSGVLKNLTTDPLSTSDGTPSSNDTVYVKAGGGLTRTKPTGSGNLIQNVGKVGRVNSANAGSLAVSTIMRTNDVPNLTTGKIWVGSPTYTTESGVVHLDEANGRMGIGTTSPAQKLHVDGSIRVGDTNDVVYADKFFTVSNANLHIGTNNGYDTVFFNGPADERMRITSSGNVGIGTTSPSGTLNIRSVSSTGSEYNLLSQNNSGTQLFYVRNDGVVVVSNSYFYVTSSQGAYFDGSIKARGGITDDGGTLGLGGGGSTSHLNILSSGNVGIGTTSPEEKLDVNGNINIRNTAGGVRGIKRSDNGYNLHLAGGSSLTTGSYIEVNGGSRGGVGNALNGEINLVSGGSYQSSQSAVVGNYNFKTQWNGGSATLMHIDSSSGNVGIGTTSPNELLEIKSTTIPGIRLNSTDTSFPTFGSITAYSNTTYRGGLSWANNPAQAGAKITYIGFPSGSQKTGTFEVGADFVDTTINNGSMVTRLNTTGLGIGTTSPNRLLTVQTTSTGSYIAMNASTGNTTIGSDVNGGFIVYDDTNSSYRMVINRSTGNVGIGTTSPNAKLHVYNTGNGEIEVERASGALVNIQAQSAKGLIGTDSNHTFSLKTNSSERLTILTSGNVGIGTTSPSAKLDVSGDVQFDNGDFNVLNSSSGNFGGRSIARFRNGSDLIQFGDVEDYDSGQRLEIDYLNRIANFRKFSVGIDAASPAYLLDVSGDGRVNGTFRCVSLIQTSQRDQKTEIELVGKETTSLPIKRYKYKSGDNNKLRYGVVAEDIESSYPELVETDAEGIKGVKYIDFLVRKIAELETEKRTLVNWRHYHSNTSYNMLYDTGMTTAFPYAYGSIPAPYDMYFTSFTLVNNPYSSYNKGPEGDTAIVQAYVNNTLVHEIRDIRYGNNPFESITVDFGQNVALRQGEALQIRFQANGAWRYCNSTIILTEK